MKLWKHILEEKNLGIVLAPNRKSAERIWKRIYPQSEDKDSSYFLEEATEFSEIDEPEGIVKDWNDQLIRQETEKLLQEEKEESRATQSGIDMDSNGEIEVSESDEKKHTYHRGR